MARKSKKAGQADVTEQPAAAEAAPADQQQAETAGAASVDNGNAAAAATEPAEAPTPKKAAGVMVGALVTYRGKAHEHGGAELSAKVLAVGEGDRLDLLVNPDSDGAFKRPGVARDATGAAPRSWRAVG